MSFQSFLSSIESEFETVEADVMAVIMKIKTGVAVVTKDISNAWTWISAHSQEISSDAAMVASGIQTLQAAGIKIPQAATTAIADMNTAVNVLNAAVGASNAGANPLGILVAGYTAAKQAQGGVADAAAAIAAVAPPVVAGSVQQASGS